MNRINLQAKIVALIVFLLVGSFVLQSAVDHFSKQKLLVAVTGVAEDLTDEVIARMMESLLPGTESTRALDIASTPRRTVRIVSSGGRRYVHGVERGEQIEIQMRDWHRQLEDYLEARLQEGEGLIPEERAQMMVRDLKEMEFPELAQSDFPQGPQTEFPQTMVSPFDGGFFETAERLRLFEGSPESQRIPLAPYTERLERIFRDFRRFDMLSALGILLLGISLAWFLGVRITRPMTELSEAFQRVASGDLQHRVNIEGNGEFALLTEQFNRMAEALAQNQELERELVLRERIQHMGDLAAGVAHDIRNPLNAIHLNMGQIRDEFLPADETKQERFLRFTSDVQGEVERLNELVTNYLSLAQPPSTDMEHVAPNDLLEEVGRLLKKEAAARRVELTLDLEDELPVLEWNRLELKSAFLNVAINALQSMEPDGGKLDVITSIRDGVDAVRGDGAGGDGATRMLAVSFNDTGCGISEENLKKIFVPYFTTRKGGTGLGMAVARRIAERHGGRMQVSSRLSEGTSVSFLFPLGEGGAVIGGANGGELS